MRNFHTVLCSRFCSSCINLHSHQQWTRSFFLHILTDRYGLSDRYEVIISLCFKFAFPFWLVMLTIFSCPYWPSVCLFCEKCLFRSADHFSVGLFDKVCKLYLCVLDINALVDIWFANIFSHLVVCLFISLLVSFAVQKIKFVVLTCFCFCCLCLRIHI